MRTRTMSQEGLAELGISSKLHALKIKHALAKADDLAQVRALP